MKFGPVPPSRLPAQDPQKVLLLAERWQRASWHHEKWATPAKEAFDFLENRQYTAEQIARAGKAHPLLKFNVIAPIVRLVVGYHRNNKSDVTFAAAHSGQSTEEVAATLTNLEKVVATDNALEFIDAEVFLDGLAGGRGWIDTRVDYEKNILGEVDSRALDPFSVKVDPDCDTYDVNESAAFMMIDRMVSIDEIEATFGENVAELIAPWTRGSTPLAPLTSLVMHNEVAPLRYFGQREDADSHYWDNFYSLMGDFVDVHRKTIRLIEVQHKVREKRNVMIDLETGDMKVLPVDWKQDKIEKVLYHAETVGNPCVVEKRRVERFQWTTQCADMMLYDEESPYDAYTMTGFFPYFRRGVTRGMVEDLIDAQREKNKSRSNRTEIESRTANGGWSYHENALTPIEEAKLTKFGSVPGYKLKWKGDKEPKQLQASSPAMKYERLERASDEDIRRISGVNEAALGSEDNRATSGKAIEARQRQAVISVQMYMDNFRRTKMLLGARHLHIFQSYYTEQRIYRVTGEDGNREAFVINELLLDPAASTKQITNNITLGKYSVAVTDAPLNPTFMAAQFEEMMELLEKMPQLIPLCADLIVGMSTLPQKPEWIARIQQSMGIGPPQPGAPAGPEGGQPAPTPEELAALEAEQQGGNVVQLPVRA